MRKTLLLFIVILSILNTVDAQWYKMYCDVPDINTCTPAEFECLWESVSKRVRQGAIATGIGTSLMVVGTSLILRGSNCTGWLCSLNDTTLIGILFFLAGGITDIAAIPIWIVGGHRKTQLRQHPHYNSLNLGALNLSPTINRNHFNNTYSFGISATLSF